MTRPEWDSKEFLSVHDAFLVDPESRRLRWPAGLHSSYSNSGAGVAGYVIEQVTRGSFESVMQDKVFDHLELKSATYFHPATSEQPLITGYNTDGTTPIPYWHTLYRGFGGINIRAIEMSRIISLLLGQGSLDGEHRFTAKQISRMSTPTTTIAAMSGLTYGYGLGLYDFGYKGFPMISHGGDADGYLIYLAVSPTLRQGYFLIINAFNHKAMRQLRNIVQDHIITGNTRPRKPSPYLLDPSELERVVGDYSEITQRFPGKSQSFVIFQSDGKLVTRRNGKEEILVPVNRHHFRRIWQSEATIAIEPIDDEVYFQSDGGNYRKSVTH